MLNPSCPLEVLPEAMEEKKFPCRAWRVGSSSLHQNSLLLVRIPACYLRSAHSYRHCLLCLESSCLQLSHNFSSFRSLMMHSQKKCGPECPLGLESYSLHCLFVWFWFFSSLIFPSNPSTWEQGQVDLCELKASLAYITSSKLFRTTQ